MFNDIGHSESYLLGTCAGRWARLMDGASVGAYAAAYAHAVFQTLSV